MGTEKQTEYKITVADNGYILTEERLLIGEEEPAYRIESLVFQEKESTDTVSKYDIDKKVKLDALMELMHEIMEREGLFPSKHDSWTFTIETKMKEETEKEM